MYKHLKNEVNVTEVEQVTLIADNCGSQNKSRMTNQMLVHAFSELPNVRVINYLFLEKGHTQNANDSIHSSIEQAKRGVTINHPCQWETIARTACKSKPYKVELMRQQEIYDFHKKDWGPCTLMMKNQQTDLNGRKTKIMWSQIRQIQIQKRSEPESPVILLYRYSLDTPFQACIIGSNPRVSKRTNGMVTTHGFHQKYSNLIPVTRALKLDLLKLCKALAIDPNFHKFYLNMSCTDKLLTLNSLDDFQDNINIQGESFLEPEDTDSSDYESEAE